VSPGEHSGGSRVDGGAANTHQSCDEQIHLLALDDFVKGRGTRDLINIDLERAALLAPSGMKETLARHRPEMVGTVTAKTAPELARVPPSPGF
jgi:hypothetical protein